MRPFLFLSVLIAQVIPSHLPPHNNPISPQPEGILLSFHVVGEPLTHSPFINMIPWTVNLASSFFHNHAGFNTPRCSAEQREVPLLRYLPSLGHGIYLPLLSIQGGKQPKRQVSLTSEPHYTHFCRTGAMLCLLSVRHLMKTFSGPSKEQCWPPGQPSPRSQFSQQLKDEAGTWTHFPVGRNGQDSWSTPLPCDRSARNLISKGSQGFGGERCFQVQSLWSVLNQRTVVFNKMVVTYWLPNIHECFCHSSYWGNNFLIAL